MIRTTAVPRQLRVGAAAASVVGIALLAGCSGASATGSDTTDDTDTTTGSTSGETTSTDTTSGTGDSDYADGTYTAQGSYYTPEGDLETVTVTLTLESDVVTAVEVTGNPQEDESVEYQAEFIGGIAEVVVGVDIDELSVSRVAGSSLTSGGFNAAVEEIKSEAAA